VGNLVCTGAALQCSMGAAPATFAATGVEVSTRTPAGVVSDTTMASVASFGLCQSPSNPQVAAATAAASGVLTPQPCVPLITGPWTPGAGRVMLSGVAALDDASQCSCTWGGSITVSSAGQTDTTVV
jgi:hypothetical protein